MLRERQDGERENDPRTLLAKVSAFAALLLTRCARKQSRGFAATSLRQPRASNAEGLANRLDSGARV